MPMLTLLFLFLTLLCLYMIFLYFVRLLSNRSGSRYADVRVRTRLIRIVSWCFLISEGVIVTLLFIGQYNAH